jgi:16S rRNA processing protein RimM
MERRVETSPATCQSLKRLPKNTPSDSPPCNDAVKPKIGKVVGFLGLKGTLKLRLFTNNPSLFLEIQDVTFRLATGGEVGAKVKSVRLNKQIIELLLQNHSTRTSVEHLLHADVFVEPSQIADLGENEWWVRDLIGLKVFTTDGCFIGTVCDALGKEGEFLEIKRTEDPGRDTVLVPFVRQLVPVVDIAAGKIEVVNLPGLFD